MTSEPAMPSGPLTIHAARQIALRDNPDVHAARARLDRAVARVDEAQAKYAPTLFFTHYSARTFQTPSNRNRLGGLLEPLGPLATEAAGPFAVTTLLNALRRPLDFGPELGDRNPFTESATAFTLTWVAFDGFVRDASLRAARYLERAAEKSREDVQRLVLDAVDRAYFEIQLAEERIRIARADEEFSRLQLAETEKLLEAGRASQAETNNFRVRMLAAQSSVVAAMGLHEAGRIVLAELIGVPDAVLPSEWRLSALEDETESEMQPVDPAPWLAQALAARPDILQLEQMLKGEEENVRAARGAFYPTVGVAASWGLDRTSNLEYGKEDQSSAVGVEFRWELYTGGAKRARVRQAESGRTEMAAKLQRVRLAIIAEVRQATIDVGIAQQQIGLQRENVKTTQENRRMIEAAYRAGKESLNRLNEAQRDFVAAEAELASARVRLRQAWSRLQRAAGAVEP
jgi:outer membrane protein TolC